jgi:radical SAM superfamily enzyme YgiQ (UPF0313 family)
VREVLPSAAVGFLNGVETAEVAALRAAVQHNRVDFVALGDSEDALEEILHRRAEGQIPAGIIERGADGTAHEGAYREATDLNTLAFPEWSLFRWRDYAISSHRYSRLPLLPVLGSRACPYRCDFCPQALFNTRQRHRVRDPGNVFAEIEQLVDIYRVREVEFYDATFGTRPHEARELCRLLSNAGRSVSWSCNSRCDLLSDDLLAAMAQAGCRRILFGVESGDQRILDATGKNQDLAQVRETFVACRKHGIETIASFIIGLPGETPETVQRTIDLALELRPSYAQFHLARAIIDKPRWRSAGQAIGGWEISEEGFNGLAYLPSGFTSYDQLRELHRRAYLRFYGRPSYVVQRLAGMTSPAEVRRLATGVVLLAKQLLGAAHLKVVRN